MGKAFLDQDFDAVRHVIDTNITGTIYLIQKVGRDMRARGERRILVTGSIAGFMLQSAIANITPAGAPAEQHRKMAAPGMATKSA